MPSGRLLACLAVCSAAAGGFADGQAHGRRGCADEPPACIAPHAGGPAGQGPAEQGPKGEPQDESVLARELRLLEARLQTPPRPSVDERERVLQKFLDEHQALGSAPEVLRARLLLGGVCLQRLDLERARIAFAAVAERVDASGGQLGAAAHFGLHQALLLQGEVDAARHELLQIELATVAPETRVAVRVALEHLDNRVPIEVGRPLPELRYGRDTARHEVNEKSFRPGPRLLVFFSLAHAPAQRRLDALAQAWQRLGLPNENLVAFALEDDDLALRRFVDQQHWKFPVLPAGGRGYLQPDWLRLRVAAVPTVFVVDGNGTLLARDVMPERLTAVLPH